jgi:amino acid permease
MTHAVLIRASPHVSPETQRSRIPAEGNRLSEHGSTVIGAIFNFTNSIVGAGAIGLGGAISQSGGLVSILAILFFAVLTKVSLDLVVRLSVESEGATSYEDLGHIGFGWKGRMAVVMSKFLYSCGCLVAYIIVVKDNLGPSLLDLFYSPSAAIELEMVTSSFFSAAWFQVFLAKDVWVTWAVSTVVILPLCLLRDMTPLASLSFVSVVSMIVIVTIIIYLYVSNPHDEIQQPGGSFYENWLQVRWGFLECLGTFVFTFVSQHTVHLVYHSLKPQFQTVEKWQIISLASIGLSSAISLSVGVFVYMSFWQQTKSDIFEIYPAIQIISLAKLLLCVTMLLTFPLPFFACRELLIIMSFPTAPVPSSPRPESVDHNVAALEEPLLTEGLLDESFIKFENRSDQDDDADKSMEHELCRDDSMMDGRTMDLSALSAHAIQMLHSCLLQGEERQLKLPYHVVLTCKLWVVVTALAISAPNLGDILNLVGCATGTLIAFVFPACLAFRLQGYSDTAMILLIVGTTVGLIGTFTSLKQLVTDMRDIPGVR